MVLNGLKWILKYNILYTIYYASYSNRYTDYNVLIVDYA